MFDIAGGGAMRQRQEQDVARLQRIGMDELQARRRAHIRVDGVDVASGIFTAGDLRDFDAGMEGQQAQEFAPGVAAAADDAY